MLRMQLPSDAPQFAEQVCVKFRKGSDELLILFYTLFQLNAVN